MSVRSKLLVLLFFVSLPLVLLAQLAPIYTFQKDDSLLKRKYFNEALAKKKILLNLYKKENEKEFKQAYDNMFKGIEELVISHLSVTELNADNYIKAVAQKIINTNPELKQLDIRIIFSRDITPNAYSMGDGTIVFNAGLFVYLKNEAEMTFVLCHELAHYYLDHSTKKIEKLISVINSDSLKQEIKRLSKQEYRVAEQFQKLYKSFVFDLKRHSRDGEIEADKTGLKFFRNTGYTGSAFISTMHLLDKVDDTTLFKPLDLRKMLSFPDYPFKERWIKKESLLFGEINAEDISEVAKKELDSLKTHPDCSKRIELLSQEALKIDGRNFQEDENLFKKLQEDFIPEIVEAVFKSGNVGYNLYLSLQLLQDKRYMPLAIYSIARDLNLFYEKQKNHELGLITDSEKMRYEEGYNLLLRMINKLRLSEIADLNASFCLFYKEQMKGYELFEEEHKKANQNKLSHQ